MAGLPGNKKSLLKEARRTGAGFTRLVRTIARRFIAGLAVFMGVGAC
jgi:hypothetical protein